MRAVVVAALVLVACDQDKVDNSLSCVVPAFGTQDEYSVFSISPGRVPVVTSDSASFSISVATDGLTYLLTWSDPVVEASCFTGIITITGTFSSAPTGVSGLEMIAYNQSNQIAFASTPGASVDGIRFVAPTKPVSIAGFVNGTANTDIWYTNSMSLLDTTVGGNVALFTHP